MTLKDVMFALCTTDKVIIRDDEELYEWFEIYTDAFLWTCRNPEHNKRQVTIISPIVFEGDNEITTIISIK